MHTMQDMFKPYLQRMLSTYCPVYRNSRVNGGLFATLRKTASGPDLLMRYLVMSWFNEMHTSGELEAFQQIFEQLSAVFEAWSLLFFL